jgi:Tol biopolymer transport system component
MRSLAALALAVVGCGRWGFADHDGGRGSDGAGGESIASIDADVLGQRFTTIVPLTEVNDPVADEDDPSLTADLLEIYFDSDRPATGAAMGDVWVAKRASATDAFGAPQLVAELASPSDDTTPEVSADGLTIFFSSDRANAGDRDIWTSTRPDRSSPWATPTRVAELSTAQTDDSPELLPDGLHMVMSQGPGMNLDLMLTTRASVASPWSTPVPLPGLSNPGYDESQQWAAPGLTVIYFVTDTPPSESEDIWLATRPDTQSAFTITRVGELASPVIDVDPWLTPDLGTMYFASRRNGTMDIFVATH